MKLLHLCEFLRQCHNFSHQPLFGFHSGRSVSPRVWSRLIFDVDMELHIFLEAMQRNSAILHIETEVVLIVPVEVEIKFLKGNSGSLRFNLICQLPIVHKSLACWLDCS
jgi:hypothetical protein